MRVAVRDGRIMLLGLLQGLVVEALNDDDKGRRLDELNLSIRFADHIEVFRIPEFVFLKKKKNKGLQIESGNGKDR